MNNELGFRAITTLLLVSALTISSYFRHKAERQGGSKSSSEGQRLVIWLRLLGLLSLLPLIGYLIRPAWVAWARFPAPVWLRWAAAAFATCIVPALYWLFAILGNNVSPTETTRQGHQLVTTGPYRYIRHPLYTLGTLFFGALTLVTGLWWMGVGLAIGLVMISWRTPREEAHLLAAFGDEYRRYMERTGRYLPRLL